MELLSKTLPKTHNLILASDLHDGSVLFRRDSAKAIVSRVQSEPDTFIALGGDLIEAICVDDKRYQSATTEEPIPLVQAQNVIDLLRPISDKILFILGGNHEWALHKFGDIAKFICEQLGVFYGTYTCKCSIRDEKNRQMYKLFYTHGAGSIKSTADDPLRREANMKLQLKQKLKNKAADCELMCMGHTHKLIVAEPMNSLYLTDDGKKLKQNYTGPGAGAYIPPDLRWYANTGSLMKLYAQGTSGYAERFGLDPVELGFVEVIVKEGRIQSVEKRVI